jgi:integrase
MNNNEMDTSKATVEWLNSKKQNVSEQYKQRWETWLDYCRIKEIPDTGTLQLEDMKKRRMSSDNTTKFFYDNEVPKYFKWLRTEYEQKKGRTVGKPLSEGSALAFASAVRSFFSYHRYSLQIRKDALPSSEKLKAVYKDHRFDVYQLRAMFKQGDLAERTALACGVNLWLRVGDFAKLERDLIELAIKREAELAENESREPDIVEFELITEKEKEPASCHLSKEAVELLKEYMRTYPKKNGQLFPLTDDALNDLIKRLADNAKITLTGRVRWHCLRKFGITLMHGKVTEPVMKYMTGKHISKDLRTYIQNNRETYKAFKAIEPLISLTKTNGNGSSQLAKELEEMKKETFKRIAQQKLIEKLFTKEQLEQAMKELAHEYGLEMETKPKQTQSTKLEPVQVKKASTSIAQKVELEPFITRLADQIEKKDLERILKENGNNDH